MSPLRSVKPVRAFRLSALAYKHAPAFHPCLCLSVLAGGRKGNERWGGVIAAGYPCRCIACHSSTADVSVPAASSMPSCQHHSLRVRFLPLSPPAPPPLCVPATLSRWLCWLLRADARACSRPPSRRCIATSGCLGSVSFPCLAASCRARHLALALLLLMMANVTHVSHVPLPCFGHMNLPHALHTVLFDFVSVVCSITHIVHCRMPPAQSNTNALWWGRSLRHFSHMVLPPTAG